MEVNYPKLYKRILVRFFKEKSMAFQLPYFYEHAREIGANHIPWQTCFFQSIALKNELGDWFVPFYKEVAKAEFGEVDKKILDTFSSKCHISVLAASGELSHSITHQYEDKWINKYLIAEEERTKPIDKNLLLIYQKYKR